MLEFLAFKFKSFKNKILEKQFSPISKIILSLFVWRIFEVVIIHDPIYLQKKFLS